LVLGDEINRASPKTQSALLEAMEERQVTLEGETRALPDPFFVIATQNPSDQSGTHSLPESQLDRFMMRISLGYPSEEAEKQLLKGIDRRLLATQLQAVLNESTLGKVQELASKVQCSDSIIDYVYRLSALSRLKSNETHGLSPRANIALIQAAKAWAFIEGRDHVLPDDIQAVFPSVAEHRLSNGQAKQSNPLSQNILKSVDIF
jgi:MoxR-like ATPase